MQKKSRFLYPLLLLVFSESFTKSGLKVNAPKELEIFKVFGLILTVKSALNDVDNLEIIYFNNMSRFSESVNKGLISE